MLHLYVIVGIPAGYERYIDARVRRKISSDAGEVLLVPMPPGYRTPKYSEHYRSLILRACYERVQNIELDDAFSITLLYASNESVDVEYLLGDFFSFYLVCPFRPLDDVCKPNLINREIKLMVDYLVPICINTRNKCKIIQDHLSSKIRHTPLLLPVKNFSCKKLSKILKNIQNNFEYNINYEVEVKNIVKSFDNNSSKKKVNSENHYVNSDGLVFVAPRYNEFHGHASGEEHPYTCYLRSRARLGGSFNPRLHYDCQRFEGSLKDAYLSCHSQLAPAGKATYLNISPNDHVRPG